MTSKPTEPCPGCDEGWRVIGKPFCSECYEGKIEQLRAERDAAARDMRERCMQHVQDAGGKSIDWLAAQIGALPLVATQREGDAT